MFVLVALVVVFLAFYVPFMLASVMGWFLMRLRPGPVKNQVAAPGYPCLALPLVCPLVFVPEVWNAFSKSIQWLLKWPSITELLMCSQIIPLLLLPFPQLLSNTLEEILSWFYGKSGEAQCPNMFRNPIRFASVILWRVGRSVCLLLQWYSFLLGWEAMENTNHALNNFFQGIDFSLPAGFNTNDVGDGHWLTKQNTQLMAMLSRLAYERWHVARTIVQNWTAGGFQFECAWHFDDITLDNPDPNKARERAYVKTSAFLLTAQAGRVAILVFRGTEPLENVGWLTNFDTVPPDDPSVQGLWTYEKYHSGFRHALGLGLDLEGDPSVECRYLIQEGNQNLERRTADRSPYNILTDRVRGLLTAGGEKLYVTGHSLGGALANLYVAAATIPPAGNSLSSVDIECALFTFGQPRVGNNQYARKLVERLNGNVNNETQVRYIRVVNTTDIVPRVPPPQGNFYQHSGHLVFLKPAASILGNANRVALNPVAATGPIVFLQEQPIIFWTCAITQGTEKAGYAFLDYWYRRPRSSALIAALSYLSVYTTLILVIPLLPFFFFLPLSCLGLLVFGVAWLGLPTGVLDHSLGGYETAIANSIDGDWDEV